MGLLDQIRAHSQPELVRTIEVPEWGASPADPLVIHYTMVTVGDMAEVQQAAPNNPSRQEAELVCLKSADAKGVKLFRRVDVLELLQTADPIVVHRIADAMMRRETAEAIEKN